MDHHLDQDNITHSKKQNSLPDAIQELKKCIVERGDLPHATVDQQIQMVEDMLRFPLGRFFLEHRGVNGYWTDYIINYPYSEEKKINLNALEYCILYRFPITLATRERVKIFQTRIQQELHENMVLASIPCGCMRDLLNLDYSKISNFTLIGIDIDADSLNHARNLATQKRLKRHTRFIRKDAWRLGLKNEVNLITSNGLNVYEPDQKRVRDLYNTFYQALKPNGILIIGVLTYPPDKHKDSEWKIDLLSKEDLLTETILFQDILNCNWRNFRTREEIYTDFYDAGFATVEILYDKYHIFPTVVAKKSNP